MPWRRWHSAHLVRNHAETQRGLGGSRQKGYRRVAGVSARRSDAAAKEKHMESLWKLTFCPPARQADAHRIIVNKTKDELDSSIKITSPHRNDRDRSLNVRRSHLPLKLEPVEAGGSWRSWCRCFYYFWHVVMCELCFSWEEERDVVVLEAVGLWACNVQISAKDLVQKKAWDSPLVFESYFELGVLFFIRFWGLHTKEQISF